MTQSYQTQRLHPHHMHNTQTHRCICSRSRIECHLSQRSRSQGPPSHSCQTRTPTTANSIHIDNTTTIGIVSNTIKWQRSRAMEMRYFWLLDGKMQKYFKFFYQPGKENLEDYPSKHHTADIHQHVHPYYVHTDKSPTLLLQALKTSIWQGCAEILGDPDSKKSPLPHIGTI
jgi:hypothetical protein